ncbi:MAG: DUF3108 domain-containing protein [Chloroflexi bacterium]|nr:DUF3108 domain-containing protein [Chloroflexota bacterium]
MTTQVFAVAKPLPRQEETTYTLLDSKGDRVGTARFTITPEGEALRAGIAYDFGPTQQDTSSIVLQPDTMKPASSERTVVEGDKRSVTRAEYTGDKVATIFDDGKRNQRREAKISDTAYDNLASLFLWRTFDMTPGREVRYANIVVDPRNGTISRALATLTVAGREEVRLPSGTSVQAWRVRFTSAGTTNTAWYRDDDSRVLVKYEITRGPTLFLDAGP